MTHFIVGLILCLIGICNVFGGLQMPLRDAALKKGIFIGSEANYDHLIEDEQFGQVLGVEYSLMTAGNACKWQATEPHYNVYNFTQCDYCYNFAVSKNMTFRGHNC